MFARRKEDLNLAKRLAAWNREFMPQNVGSAAVLRHAGPRLGFRLRGPGFPAPKIAAGSAGPHGILALVRAWSHAPSRLSAHGGGEGSRAPSPPYHADLASSE